MFSDFRPSIFLALFLFSACASSPDKAEASKESKRSVVETSADVSRDTIRKTGDGFTDAALSPLEDLNLKRDKIPAEFDQFNTPYDPLIIHDCDLIAARVRQLDTQLEADFDVQLARSQKEDETGKDDNGEKIASQASGFALGTIASEARGLIPFRGLVRHATGASAHEKAVDAAFQKAYLRRAYLKGLGKASGCVYPAAPLDLDYSDEEIGAPISYRNTQPD